MKVAGGSNYLSCFEPGKKIIIVDLGGKLARVNMYLGSAFLYRARLLTVRPLKQCYVAVRLKLSLQKFYGRHHELVNRNGELICTKHENRFF